GETIAKRNKRPHLARNEREAANDRRRGRRARAGTVARSLPGQLRPKTHHLLARSLRIARKGDRPLPRCRQRRSSSRSEAYLVSARVAQDRHVGFPYRLTLCGHVL